ncbi:MAG: YqaE/Pmp3 family membrane protein [Proteobacteria bacterium]|nr:MAG: YqaE/Pmp3 family membrane protein [Pseudomonadota bacterium]
MRYILALFFPWLTFFTMSKPFQGIICLVLQITLIGWIPATIWSFISITNFENQQRLLNHNN